MSAKIDRSAQRNIRMPRLSKTPSIRIRPPAELADVLAPTSVPVNSSGGVRTQGKAEEAATASGTVASPIGVWSIRNVFPGSRRNVSKPSRVNEHKGTLAQDCGGRCGVAASQAAETDWYPPYRYFLIEVLPANSVRVSLRFEIPRGEPERPPERNS